MPDRVRHRSGAPGDRHRGARRTARLAALALVSATLAVPSHAAVADPLEQGFADPPPRARPRVWWHWMNGNVSAQGARLDLQWMKRAGIGGVQLFEGGLGVPQVVPERLTFMSAPWQAALRASADEASRLGLELGIATSPGWSATGGPWVRPVDAMKKLVWTRTPVRAGHGVIRLPRPSGIAGPYLDIAAPEVAPGSPAGPDLYRDARVLAFPIAHAPDLPKPHVSAETPGPDVERLSDGRYGDPIRLRPDATGTAGLLYDYGRLVTLRSAQVAIVEPTGFGAPRPTIATIEASDDGRTFRLVATLGPGGAPVRVAGFAPVSGRWFRVRFAQDAAPGYMDGLTYAPGAIHPAFGPPATPSFAVSEIALGDRALVDHAAEKAGFATVPDYDALPSLAAAGVDPARVVDLTDRLRADGTLDWTPPAGDWIVLRLGWSPTGHRNGPAPDKATGLEVDKLDPARVAAYLDHYLGLYDKALRPAGVGMLHGLLSDSIEAGPQNWTEGLPAAFWRLRGYDPTPWLPALTGEIVGDAARTDRFLWDWRKIISDLVTSVHYAGIAAAAHARGLTYYAEALEDHRPQLGDDLAIRATADVPMGAMWTLDPGALPKPTYVADLKGAASVANLYGKPLVAAESLTVFGHPYALAPRDLKRTVDLEFALGVNRIMIHTSPHQPLVDAAPGIALAPFLGQYFSRNETWAGMARGWTDYLARSSYLLQEGRRQADIALFVGEEAPATSLYGDVLPQGIPAGYDYDFVDADALAGRLSVATDGSLATPDGMRYRLMLLGGDSRLMTLATLRRLRALVDAGATIVGERPTGSPSLGDDDAAVRAAIAAIWGSAGAASHRGVYPADRLGEALDALHASPDWRWESPSSTPPLAITHRAEPGRDIYFVSNRATQPVSGRISLRATGRAPEFWRADTGSIADSSYDIRDGRTVVPVTLPADGAVFVVFRRSTDLAHRVVTPPAEHDAQTLVGPWTLSFQPGRGAPERAYSTDLTPWNEEAAPSIRYFSGVGTYRTTLTIAKLPPRGRRLLLDLGRVGDVARVVANGRDAGIAWKPPYRVDVTHLLRPGRNAIAVEVANLWVNRLIGDAQPGAVSVAHGPGPTYRADAPLRFSGLAGPVRLIATGTETVAAAR